MSEPDLAIPEELRDSKTVAVAWFDPRGVLLAANRGFLRLAEVNAVEAPVSTNVSFLFRSPRFEELAVRAPAAGGLLFEGTFTLGTQSGRPRDFVGRMTRAGDALRFVGELDVDAMEALQDSVLELNSDLADSRRQVARANRNLERTVAQRTAALSASEQRFRGLVEQSLVSIGIVRGDRLAYANPALLALAGRDAGDSPQDLSLPDLVAPGDRERVCRDVRALGERAGGTADLRFACARADGRRVEVEGFCRAVELEGEGSVLLVLVDVTAREQATRELRDAKELAEAADRAKAAFLATASHELRTPLNHVLGGADLLRRTALEPGQQGHLKLVSDGARRLQQLIDDVLDFTRIAAGGLALEARDFSPASVLAGLRDEEAGSARAKGLELRVEAGPGTPAAVRGDPARLAQALRNYVRNAIRFTERGSVSLAVRALEVGGDGPLLRFEVVDTGVGIVREDRERLFSRFVQADGSLTRAHGGLGLGLAVTMELARCMGGRVGCESEPGQGSTFWLEVRFARAAGALEAGVESTRPAQAERPGEEARDEEALERLQPMLAELEILLSKDDLRAAELVKGRAAALRRALGPASARLERCVLAFDFEGALRVLREARRESGA